MKYYEITFCSFFFSSQLRVCQRCFEAKINTSSSRNQPQSTLDTESSKLKATETATEPKTSGQSQSIVPENDPLDDEDDDDPDINFEVRSEKLNLSAFNSAEHSGNDNHDDDDDEDDIYSNKQRKQKHTKSPDRSVHKGT